MLWLKRNTWFNEVYKCKISDEFIVYGDYYYEDDTDGFIVRADVYHELLKKKKEDEFDYTKLNDAKSQLDYKKQLREYEKAFLTQTLFDRQIAGKGDMK